MGPAGPVGPGSVLAGRYELGGVIGRGGSADVYRAEDRVLSRAVAVKVLREATHGASERERFVAEARTVANLGHHGLVTVLDAGISDAQAEQPFLVMELVDGQPLSARIATGPLPLAEITRITLQLAESIAFAHARDVVHRDVKPGNVLLNAAGDVKLADFGIARLIGDTVRHTRTGHAVGTAAYLAPEQVLGEDLTTAVDIYSLGLVVLEMFTATLAYPGPPTEAALARLSRQPDLPADLPAPWRDLLADMTAREPSERPDAVAVAARLRQRDSTTVRPAVPPPPLATAVLPEGSAPAPAATGPSPVDALVERLRSAPREHVVLAAVTLVLVLLLAIAAVA